MGRSALSCLANVGYAGQMRGSPNSDSSLHLLPQTPLGWWAARLLLATIVLFVTSVVVHQSGPWSDPWIGFTMVPAGLAAVLSGVTAAAAIIRFEERGALTVIPLLLGLLVAWWVIGEAITSQ